MLSGTLRNIEEKNDIKYNNLHKTKHSRQYLNIWHVLHPQNNHDGQLTESFLIILKKL